MKAIIKGKLYDTEKASLIFEKSTDHPNHFRKTKVYKTDKGNWFIYQTDGQMEYLNSITEEEAKKIVSSNVETYIKIFGEPEEA